MFLSERTPAIKTASKVQWPLHFVFSCVRPITQCYRQKTVEEVPLLQSYHLENTICAPNYQLLPRKCSGHYSSLSTMFSPLHSVTNVRSVRIVSAMSLFTTENTDDSRLQMYCREAMHCATANQHFRLSARSGTQTRTKMHALYVLRYDKRRVSGRSDVEQ